MKVGDRACLSYKKSARGVITALEKTVLGTKVHLLLDSGEKVRVFYSMVWPEKFKPTPSFHGPEWSDPAYQ